MACRSERIREARGLRERAREREREREREEAKGDWLVGAWVVASGVGVCGVCIVCVCVCVCAYGSMQLSLCNSLYATLSLRNSIARCLHCTSTARTTHSIFTFLVRVHYREVAGVKRGGSVVSTVGEVAVTSATHLETTRN